MKCLIVVLLFIGVCLCGDDFSRIDSIRQESPCSSAGGICTIADDCPKGRLAEQRGLCPEQRSVGVECCYGVSVKETRCSKQGGSCIAPDDYCNPRLIFSRATDCPDNYKCCVLV
ncbi:U-scoloptoxin(19)-Sm1a-like [Achroia grisella]|uniref:U-scoloptoxin(19)-Sm1a-like n=1 Tax=Achroia grisella TaxID=688607 RepID=UPI0027D283FB|nr:U-scoloptoxin(19)-Sm1a-like [Achroia grisella]